MSTRHSSNHGKLAAIVAQARQSLSSMASARVPVAAESFLRQGGRVPALVGRGAEAIEGAFASFGSGGALLGRSFLLVVLLPTFAFFVYSAFYQSDRYVAEMRLSVRQPQEKKDIKETSSSMLSMMSGGPSSPTTQDAFMVQNYIKSRAIILDLGGREYMEKRFARPGADYFSGLRKNANVEDLWAYWLSHVFASVDTVSGIVTVKADAFEPQDALDLANDILKESEALVNQITVRNRSDALARAEAEVGLTRQKLADAREKTLQFRNQNVLFDPVVRATGLSDLMNRLQMERIDLVKNMQTNATSLAPDSPSQRLQRTRLGVIDQQLAELKKKIADAKEKDTVSAQLGQYERLKLDEQFAEQMYQIAQSAFQRARQDLDKQQLYLITIVAPSLPESATYPRVAANTILIFCVLLIGWAVVALVAASIEDHIS